MGIDTGGDLKTVGPAHMSIKPVKDFKHLFQKTTAGRIADRKKNPGFRMVTNINPLLYRKIEAVIFTALLIKPEQPGNPFRRRNLKIIKIINGQKFETGNQF